MKSELLTGGKLGFDRTAGSTEIQDVHSASGNRKDGRCIPDPGFFQAGRRCPNGVVRGADIDEVTVIHPLITVDVEYRLAPTAVARVESVDNRIAL